MDLDEVIVNISFFAFIAFLFAFFAVKKNSNRKEFKGEDAKFAK